MKLCIMKQECLDSLKGNLEKYCSLYFSDKTNEWIETVCGQNPFKYFGKDIPDFKLAELNDDKTYSDIDLENCKIIYSNLRFLTESQASDERLWAGLTNGVFYDYMRRRCEYDVKSPKEKEKQASEIKSRYFFKGGSRSGFYRNFLAKCWWVGRALYDENNTDHFWKLDILGSRDFSTKTSDIFYSNTFASNPEILDGIILFFKYLNDEDIHYRMKEEIRPCIQHLNNVGGAIILDCLSADEIRDELIDYYEHLLIGDEMEIHSTINVDDVELDEETEKYANINSTKENTPINDNKEIVIGDIVTLVNKETGKESKYFIEVKEGGKLLAIPEMLLGKSVGEEIEISNTKYLIDSKKFTRKTSY